MRTSWWPYVIAALSALTSQAAENDLLVEARDGKTVTTGKLLAKDTERAMLLDRVGGLHDLSLDSITLKATTSRFQPLPTMELRNQLSREFGKDFGFGSTRHFVVVAPAQRASDYAAVFEEQYVTLQRYFKTRGFSLSEPQFPMVAIVFPTQRQFGEYASRDGSKVTPNMQGYYSPRTNRVALFEPSGKSVAVSAIDSLGGIRTPAIGSINTDLRETMIHEATHQVAYNIGLHSRVGQTPRWVVEGMATVFEPEAMRTATAGSLPKQRLNWERHVVFQNYAQSKRRPPKSLRSFVESDDLHDSAVLDFYAQSWALTFFLVETRPRNYSAYLKRIAARDPFSEYPASERLADFRETIHADIDWLDGQFIKYFEGLR